MYKTFNEFTTEDIDLSHILLSPFYSNDLKLGNDLLRYKKGLISFLW